MSDDNKDLVKQVLGKSNDHIRFIDFNERFPGIPDDEPILEDTIINLAKTTEASHLFYCFDASEDSIVSGDYRLTCNCSLLFCAYENKYSADDYAECISNILSGGCDFVIVKKLY